MTNKRTIDTLFALFSPNIDFDFAPTGENKNYVCGDLLIYRLEG
jgi:hypothetical protein